MADHPQSNTNRTIAISRRSAVIGALASVGGVAGASAQQTTPHANPTTSPLDFLTPTSPAPQPEDPLSVIHDQRPPWAGTPMPGGEIRLIARSEDLSDFTPTTFRQDFGVLMSVLDPLIWVDEVTLVPEPWLATAWSWSDDKLTLDITLRNDVTWHDGTDLTADDVQFSLLAHRDDAASASFFMLAVVSDVVVSDDTHLTVRFDEPDGTFPFNAANLPVFQRAQWEAHWLRNAPGERTLAGMAFDDTRLIGTGPWALERIEPDRVTLRRNQAHFAAVPLAESLTVQASNSPEDQLDAWKQDKADLVWPFPGEKIQNILQEDGSLVAADSTISHFAAFNFGNPTRLDPGWMVSAGLREALNLVVNRKAYAESVFGGMIDVERAGFMTQPWAIDKSVKNPRRNLAAARRMLADNGWADWDGDGVLDSPAGDRGEFVCIVHQDADPQLLAVLDTLDSDFRDLGFQLEVQQLPVNEFTTRWTSAFDYDLIALTLNQYAAFNEFDLVGFAWSIRRNPAGWNPGGYWNPEVDQALVNYLQAVDMAEMKRELAVVQQRTNEDPFALWLGFPKQPVLVRPGVSGFQPNKIWQSWNTWSLWLGAEASLVTPTPIPPTPADPDATAPGSTQAPGTPPSFTQRTLGTRRTNAKRERGERRL